VILARFLSDLLQVKVSYFFKGTSFSWWRKCLLVRIILSSCFFDFLTVYCELSFYSKRTIVACRTLTQFVTQMRNFWGLDWLFLVKRVNFLKPSLFGNVGLLIVRRIRLGFLHFLTRLRNSFWVITCWLKVGFRKFDKFFAIHSLLRLEAQGSSQEGFWLVVQCIRHILVNIELEKLSDKILFVFGFPGKAAKQHL